MLARRLVTALLVLATTSPLAAWSWKADYSPDAYESAKETGGLVVLDFHAGWCATCRKQESVLQELGKEPVTRGVVLLVVDFDAEKDFAKSHGVTKQSTLVVLRGDREVGRAIGITAQEEVRALLVNPR